MPAIESSFGPLGKRTYRYIEYDTPHHLQLRPRKTVKRLQLLENGRSHKQGLCESERVLVVEDTRRLLKDLLIGPKQRRASWIIPLKLHGKGPGSHQSEAIDAIPKLPGQGEERAIWRSLACKRGSGTITETEGFEEKRVESDCVRGFNPFGRCFQRASTQN